VKPQPYRRRRFHDAIRGEDSPYWRAWMGTRNPERGLATKKLLSGPRHNFTTSASREIGVISVAQLYRNARSRGYRERRIKYQARRRQRVDRGAEKPEVTRAPGYLRIDTVHQGGQGWS